MNQSDTQLFFALLRSAICGNPLQEAEINAFREDDLPKMMTLAQQHDLVHLLAYGINKNKLSVSHRSELKREIIKAVYRQELLEGELEKLCNSLEAAQVDFIPLKGSVLRQYYPEPWMRTSCDIDILVPNQRVEEVADYLVAKRGYRCEGKGEHDISLFLDDRVHLELHYTLIGEGVAQASCQVLSDVWQSTTVRKNTQYWHELNDEMFYFYHIAHMAKHFEEGGCGIRPLIDLWILDHMQSADRNQRDALLKQGNLLRFAEVARELSCVWMENKEHTDVTRQMEAYILFGGVYGNTANRIAVQQQKKGGQFRYAMSKIFIPYDVIKFHYPVLQRHRWLTPIMEVRRWFKLVFCGHAKRSLQELKYNSNITASEAVRIQIFLRNIGL